MIAILDWLFVYSPESAGECAPIWKNRNRVINKALAFIFALSAILGSAYAENDQSTTPDARSRVEPVTVEAFASHSKVAPGEKLHVALRLIVDNDWHVNSNKPNEDFLIPTEVVVAENQPATLDKVVYPDARSLRFDFSPDIPLSVFDEKSWIKAYLTVDKETPAGLDTIILNLTAQACDNRSCIAPATHELAIPIEIVSNLSDAAMKNQGLLESIAFGMEQSPADTSSGKVTSVNLEEGEKIQAGQSFWAMMRNFKADAFVERFGYIIAFIAMYLLGLGLTLTPCVYPIIPITIGYFGSQSAGKVSRQFIMAVIFGVGIAISYAAVGTIAALSGSLMGAALQSPIVLIGLAVLCFVMGLNAFGVFEIVLPGWLMNLAGGGSRRGYAGAAVMGLTMGIAAAPCLAAFIVSLLAFVGQKGDPVLGFSMFFILGLGLATPFIALGTFSGLISKVPKSGGWMVYAKKVMGALLFGATLYFLNPVLPKPLHHSLVAVALVAAGLYFGFFEKTQARTWRFKSARAFFAILFIGAAIWWDIPSQMPRDNRSGIAWQPYSQSALGQAGADGKPAIIDVYADWCIPCKELDKYSFSDPRVIEASRGVVMLKADVTKGNSPEAKQFIAQYGIKGVPTVIFISADGSELKDLRMNQFEKADIVYGRFSSLLSANKQPPVAITKDFRN